MQTERLSQEPLPASIGPRPEAAHYQRHPIPGQQRLFDGGTIQSKPSPFGRTTKGSAPYSYPKEPQA